MSEDLAKELLPGLENGASWNLVLVAQGAAFTSDLASSSPGGVREASPRPGLLAMFLRSLALPKPLCFFIPHLPNVVILSFLAKSESLSSEQHCWSNLFKK